MAFFETLKQLVFGRPIALQFEQMIIEEEARKVQATPEPVAEPVVEVVPEPVVEAVAEPVAEVVPEPVVKVTPKRAKNAKGKLVADDKSTPDVNEAWVGGKAPAKKTAKRKKK